MAPLLERDSFRLRPELRSNLLERFFPFAFLLRPRDRAPLPFLESVFLVFELRSFLLMVGRWELKVVVSEAHNWETWFRLFPLDEVRLC